MMDDTLDRLTRIAVRYARRFGASAAVYAYAKSFDIMCERWRTVGGERIYDGLAWHRFPTGDAYRTPRAVALGIRRDIRRVWAK